MQLSEEQGAALAAINQWQRARDKPYFILQGYAGTGKTTIVKELAGEGGVSYLAYTGKAALQLRLKGCGNATTIHQALYEGKDKSTKRLQELLHEFANTSRPGHKERLHEEIKAERKRVAVPTWQTKPSPALLASKLIVVDEYSMVGATILTDLLSLKIPVLFVGDPAQLPPVMDICPLEAERPHYRLQTIHRQAAENPLLRAATAVRKGDYSLLTTDGSFLVKSRAEAGWEDYKNADQVLCARNNTRRALNKKSRTMLGQHGPLNVGEKIIFLKNDHQEGVFNGSIGTVTAEPFFDDVTDEVGLNVDLGTHRLEAYAAWSGYLKGQTDAPQNSRTQAVDHAFAITVHKSQGSEWDRVLVHEEVIPGTDHKRLLYTALTRARTACTLIRD